MICSKCSTDQYHFPMVEVESGLFRCFNCKLEEIDYGRYRIPSTPHQRSTNQAPSQAGRGYAPIRTQLPAATWRTINPIKAIDPGPDLTYADLSKSMQDAMSGFIQKQYIDPLLYGTGPKLTVLKYHSKTSKPRPDLRREMQLGEIVGFRCWRLTDEPDRLLQSSYQRDIWQPGQIIEGRGLEDWDSRGVHAWKEIGDRFSDYISPANEWFCTIVTGSVYLWGDVVEHEHGYRAEFAKVKSIDWIYFNEPCLGQEQKTLDDLRAKYNV